MCNEIIKKLMAKFLAKNYPVKRVKHNMRFKRAIVTDNGSVFFLSDLSSHNHLRMQLTEILKSVFACDDLTAGPILDNFLPLK